MNLLLGSLLNFLYNELLTHVPWHGLRKTFLRIFNKKIHPTAVVLMHTRILNFWKIEIGPRAIINQRCLLDCRRHQIRIEEDVDIGPYTKIWTEGHDPDSEAHALRGGDVVLKDHVWVASGVTILPGVTLERGAVVAAASVVTKNVGTLEIVGGNPAKLIRMRHNPLHYQINYRPILE
ncbi:Acetyltransferase (isoleucine patch superfamily) [Catalinimonas alkaloidigena]|uniref:Acetyltransferase (Isoleucine patch superfamily) n=1 Tax=Catalinimonas alkaloidigena TaxID=1075417 RepID=A0A1G9LDY7_9BACT|nr:hypothetical protein [Catalinimonas alkaloidigena]SDL60170.1 Acetyltransferase (isoleucine patch superfamily) [Catalinimonas alkaloidigena]